MDARILKSVPHAMRSRAIYMTPSVVFSTKFFALGTYCCS